VLSPPLSVDSLNDALDLRGFPLVLATGCLELAGEDVGHVLVGADPFGLPLPDLGDDFGGISIGLPHGRAVPGPVARSHLYGDRAPTDALAPGPR
jgi:hypothetical protein